MVKDLDNTDLFMHRYRFRQMGWLEIGNPDGTYSYEWLDGKAMDPMAVPPPARSWLYGTPRPQPVPVIRKRNGIWWTDPLITWPTDEQKEWWRKARAWCVRQNHEEAQRAVML